MARPGQRRPSNESIRWMLVFYDMLAYLAVSLLMLVIYPSAVVDLTPSKLVHLILIGAATLLVSRFAFRIYQRIWRYGDPQSYMRLMVADGLACLAFLLLRSIPAIPATTFARSVALYATDLLVVVMLRLLYQYACRTGVDGTGTRLLRRCINLLCRTDLPLEEKHVVTGKRIPVALIGAGTLGVRLAEELQGNPNSTYIPVCFVDTSRMKVGRRLHELPVLDEADPALREALTGLNVSEVIIAILGIDENEKKRLYQMYRAMGLPVKVYDYPAMQEVTSSSQRRLREFEIEELLFRTPRDFLTEETMAYYRGKTVLITGGGGSIGSEMARQIARMQPKTLVLYDVYENGAYDIQQELRIKYGAALDLHIEISTMTDRQQLDQIFGYFKPDIVIHAAAHKHVPIMERNTIEAVKNNIFGTHNVLEVCRKHGVKRFMMVSTDKAVNPTNVMGATKRFCERMVLNYPGHMVVSCTRFGNVLGSAGSVVPLFKRQIHSGGPLTITDKRIVRYFMTIPEASQLVLTSGALAENRQLFVLDMGKPVKILDLAENMIRVSGLRPYVDIDIVETGLRPGEKLYEELLIAGEGLKKTGNDMIYIEEEQLEDYESIEKDLWGLLSAVQTMSSAKVREALHAAVPTFKDPEEVNREAEKAKEMRMR